MRGLNPRKIRVYQNGNTVKPVYTGEIEDPRDPFGGENHCLLLGNKNAVAKE
jgi:hypothetical protein